MHSSRSTMGPRSGNRCTSRRRSVASRRSTSAHRPRRSPRSSHGEAWSRRPTASARERRSWRLGASPFGRALKAMRENEAAVQSIGKNVVAMKLSVFAIAAALASVAGALYAHYVTFVSAESFTVELTIYLLAMVIVGGTGNLAGSLVGAIVLTVLPELLKFIDMPPDIADKIRQIMYGLLLILMLRWSLHRM